MYHGGSNPKGKSTPLQESRDTGFPSDLPVINYDFNAPIRQYGQISDAYREVRLLAMFLKDFGEDLAQLKPEVSPVGVRPENTQTLRTAWRHDETHGYVFFNNYQRNKVMEEQGCVPDGKMRRAGRVSIHHDFQWLLWLLSLSYEAGKCRTSVCCGHPLCVGLRVRGYLGVLRRLGT